MRRWRSSLARLSAGAMLASLLALVGNSPAQADAVPATNWTPVTIGSDLPAASMVLTDAAGGVTVGCPTGSSPTHVFKSFSSTGGVLQNQSVGNPIGTFCTGNATVGKDGTVYVGAMSSNGMTQYIQAWKNNSLVWQYQIPCGSNGVPWTMTMGANGNLYVTIWQGSSPCNNGMQLIGLTPTAQTGSNPPVPQVVVNMSLWTSIRGGGAAAYDDGMVFYTNTNSILYVPYTTTNAANLADPVAVSNVNYPWDGGNWFEAQPDGTVVLPIKATSGQTVSCANPTSRTGALATVKPNGSVTSGTLTGCWTIHEIHPFPSGGVAMRFAYSDSTTGWTDVEKVSAPGWSKQVGDPDLMTRVSMAVDLNGNIALRNNATPTYGGYIYPEITFTLMSGVTGELITSAAFALRGEHDTTDGPSYMWGGDGDISIAKNTVYVSAYQCNRWSVGCQTANTKLYAFTVPGLQMDYPRGAILKHDEPWKDYAALGDSFSSAEGVEPFLSGTDTVGPPANRCHRSTRAYARLLQNPVARLNLSAFVACSGATTGTMFAGQYNESPQFDALDAQTEVVTLTIGGNDIGFADVVTLCVVELCSFAIDNARDHLVPEDLGVKLELAYEEIQERSPNAEVYVLGYPSLVPPKSQIQGSCEWGTAMGEISETQINSLRDLGEDLNDFIEMKAVAAGFNFLPNTVFDGHELCTSDSYVIRAQVGSNSEYSIHPSPKGQDAMRWMIYEALGI